jgi:hypothetical protein
MTHAINRTDEITREWMEQNHIHCHDQLTNLLNPGPNVSILPEPWWKSVIDLPTVRLTLAIVTALALVGWLIWRMM